jgi:hypothetical protein
MSDIDITDLLERITGCINNAEYDDEADTLSDAFTVIEALEAQLKTVLDREADTHCRHDAKVEAQAAEIDRLRDALGIAIVLVAAELPYAPMLQHLREALAGKAEQ